jgi:hypothetical protein
MLAWRAEEAAVAASTSFRISDTARTRLSSRAAREGMTATALLDQLIIEGTDQLDYSGIVFRGSEEQRISILAAESDLHPRLIRIALDYAAEHSGEVRERIDRNRGMTERSRRMAEGREALLA